jgi:hypothetical protein
MVKYDSNSHGYGTIPATALVFEARDKWEDWVDDNPSIRS